jgi:uncharacterized membrane protein HdeD (DUF308 family)
LLSFFEGYRRVVVHKGSKEAQVFKILAVILVVLALVVIIVPQFTNCDADGRSLTLEGGKQVPMKCLWSARAELGLGIPLLVLGIIMLLTRRKETTRSLSILGVVQGILIILVPTSLIGVCMSSEMDCNSILKPTMLVAGILTILVSLVALGFNERRQAG